VITISSDMAKYIPCRRCGRPVEQAWHHRNPATDQIDLHIRCHGEKAVRSISNAELIANRSVKGFISNWVTQPAF